MIVLTVALFALANGWILSLVNTTVILIYAVFINKALVQYPIHLPPATTLLVIKTILIITLFGETISVDPSFTNTVLV